MIPFYLVVSLFLVGLAISALVIRIAALQWKQKKGLSYQPLVQQSRKPISAVPPISPKAEIGNILEPGVLDPSATLPQPEIQAIQVSTPAEEPPPPVTEHPTLKKEHRKRWLRGWLLGEIID